MFMHVYMTPANMYEYSYSMGFGLKTIRHLCPCALFGVAKRGFGIGTARRSLYSTLRFPKLIACLPSPLAFQVLWIH